MPHQLSDTQVRLLAEGIKRNGILPVDLFYRYYNSDEAAKSSIKSLESWGHIALLYDMPGHFAVIEAPDDAWLIVEKMKEAEKKASEKIRGFKR